MDHRSATNQSMVPALVLVIVVVCGITYHLAQRAAGGLSPWPMLLVAYATAMLTTVVIALSSNGERLRVPNRGEWVAGLLVGLAAFGIEAGYFFLYRSGWPLASASVIANVAGTAILAVIGVFLFGDQLTPSRVLGLVLAALGAALIARGGPAIE